MQILSHVKNLFVDFLFPKRESTLALEAISVEDILKTLPPADRLDDKNIVAIFDYSHPVAKEMVWEVKYKGNKVLADKLATIMYDVLLHELADLALFESASWREGQSILLIPIPVSDKRRTERGWNQAELLAESLVSHDTAKMFKYLPRQLLKIRHTESQTKTSSKSERLENLVNSMKILHAPAVANNCVILVDDVVTTGATFKEAKRALREAGAKQILCIAIAH